MRKLLARLTLLILLTSGCARTLCFRAVDAQTGAPLGGVTVERSGTATSPAAVVRTEASGTAELKGHGGRFTFRREGYYETQLEVTQSGAKVISGEDRRQQNVESHAGIVQVPLVRDPVAATLQAGRQTAPPLLR
jgi:hypothetical protein